MKKQLFWVLAGFLSFVISLMVLAPLPVLAQQLMSRVSGLQLAGVSGTLWKGQVQRLVTAQGQQVDNLSWRFDPMQLLSGYLSAHVDGHVQSVLQVKGSCGVSVLANLRCAPLMLDVSADQLGQLVPQVQLPKLSGALHGRLDDVSWDRKGLPLGNGDLTWNDAGVQSPITLPLGGQYRAKINTSTKIGEALNIALQSQDSAIVLDGNITIESDGRYQLDAFLKPSGTADPSIGDVLSMVAPMQADGSIKIKQNGQLVLPQPAPAVADPAQPVAPSAPAAPAAPATAAPD